MESRSNRLRSCPSTRRIKKTIALTPSHDLTDPLPLLTLAASACSAVSSPTALFLPPLPLSPTLSPSPRFAPCPSAHPSLQPYLASRLLLFPSSLSPLPSSPPLPSLELVARLRGSCFVLRLYFCFAVRSDCLFALYPCPVHPSTRSRGLEAERRRSSRLYSIKHVAVRSSITQNASIDTTFNTTSSARGLAIDSEASARALLA